MERGNHIVKRYWAGLLFCVRSHEIQINDRSEGRWEDTNRNALRYASDRGLKKRVEDRVYAYASAGA